MMADWMHCNLCLRQPFSDANARSTRFYLTNCAHLLCENCTDRNATHCKICQAQCKLLALTSPLKSDVSVYFSNPMDLLQQRFKEIAKVMEFQNQHRENLQKGYKDKISAHQETKAKLHTALSQIAELEKENEYMRQENVRLSSALKKFNFPATSRSTSPNYNTLTPTGSTVTPLNKRSPENLSATHHALSNTHDYSLDKLNRQTSTPTFGLRRLSIISPPSNGKIGTVMSPSESEFSPVELPSRKTKVSPYQESSSDNSRIQAAYPPTTSGMLLSRNTSPTRSSPYYLPPRGNPEPATPAKKNSPSGLMDLRNQYLSPASTMIGLAKPDYPSSSEIKSYLNTSFRSQSFQALPSQNRYH